MSSRSARTENPRRKGALASLRTAIEQPGAGAWRAPTRRGFVAMLGAAAAAFAVTPYTAGRPRLPSNRDQPEAALRRSAAAGMRWIGHC